MHLKVKAHLWIMLLAFLLVGVFPASATTVAIPAVTSSGGGEPVLLSCKVVPGSGRVFITVPPFTATDTQRSELNAIEAAARAAGVNPNAYDYYFIFNSSIENVEGGSGGLAMALCILAELEDKDLPLGVCATGAIDSYGNVLPVGGLLEKIKGTAETCRYFLFPASQEKIVVLRGRYYSPVPGIYIKETEPIFVNLTEYASKNFNVTAVPVAHLVDAYQFLLYNISAIGPHSIEALTGGESPLEAINQSGLRPLERLELLAEYELKKALKILEKTNRTEIRYYVEQAMSYPEWSPYSKANMAFIAVTLGSESSGARIIAGEIAKHLKNQKAYADLPWVAEAELRVSWALFFDDPEPMRFEWATAAAYILALSNSSSGVIPKETVKDLADKLIVEAGNAIEDAKAYGINCREADKYFEAAKMSFSDGLYAAAMLNAIDAKAMAESCILSSVEQQKLIDNYTTREFPHEWPEAYRRHAIITAASGGLKDAAYLLLRAKYREEAYQELSKEAASYTMKEGVSTALWIAVLVAVGFLAGYFFRDFFRKKKKLESGLKGVDEIEWLEVKARVIKELEKKYREGKLSKEAVRRILEKLEGV